MGQWLTNLNSKQRRNSRRPKKVPNTTPAVQPKPQTEQPQGDKNNG